ncbi:SRPBCC family protein [Sphaerotilus sulfidivorans]
MSCSSRSRGLQALIELSDFIEPRQFFKLTTTTVSRIFETPESEIRFDLVSGNLKRMQGSWTLTPHDHAIGVGYRAELVPEFAVPPLIGPAVMAQNVKAMAEGVAREIERRKLANTKE